MGSLALEPDFVLEAPDIQRDYETHTAKRKLIPPVSEVIYDKRKRAKQFATPPKPVEIDRVKPHEFVDVKRNPNSLKYAETICKILRDLEQPNPPPSPLWIWYSKLDRQFIKAVTKLLDALYPF